MGITAKSGPDVIFGVTLTSTNGLTGSIPPGSYNEERAPSLYDMGTALADPRAAYSYKPGSAVGTLVYGFWNNQGVVDQMPTTISTNTIAQTQVPVAGTALTLTATDTKNATVGVSIVAPETGQTVTGLIAIDGTSVGGLTFGSGATVSMWDPTKGLSRCITIVGSTKDDSGMYWAVAGRDVYGYKVTEQIPGSSGGSTTANAWGVPVTSQKAFKYITGITPVNSTGTLGSTNVIVGVSDTYGLPLRVDRPGQVYLMLGASSLATVPAIPGALLTFATTNTATSTTGDVRGTYASSVASSTAAPPVRFFCAVTPSVNNINSLSATDMSGLFGVAQYSSV